MFTPARWLRNAASLTFQARDAGPPRDRAPSTVPLWFELAVVAVMLVLGTFWYPLKATGRDLSMIPGDIIDGRFNNWVLEHGYQYVTGRVPNFWTAPSFYPTPYTLALSDSHMGTIPIYSGFRLSGVGRETSYQLWFLTLCGLNFLTAHLAMRAFGCGVLGSAAGSFVFAYGLPMHEFFAHLQIVPRMGVPLVLYWMWRFLRTGRTSYWLGAGLAGVWQLAATIYIAWFLALAGFAFVLGAAIVHHGEVRQHVLRAARQQWLRRGGVLAICAGLAYLIIRIYIRTARPEQYDANLEAIETMMPHWHTWFNVFPESPLWSRVCRFATGHTPPYHYAVEGHYLFLGGTTALAFIALLWIGRSTQRPLWQLGVIAALSLSFPILLTMNLGNNSLYWLLTELPGVAAIRCLPRVAVVILFPAGLLVAIAITRFEEASRREWGATTAMIVGVALISTVVVDHRMASFHFPCVAKAECQARVAELVERVRAADPAARSAVLLVRFEGAIPFCASQIDMMLAAQELGIATPNGFSGHNPRGWMVMQGQDDVEAWKKASLELYGSTSSRMMKYYHRHQFDHMVILGP